MLRGSPPLLPALLVWMEGVWGLGWPRWLMISVCIDCDHQYYEQRYLKHLPVAQLRGNLKEKKVLKYTGHNEYHI